MLTEEKKKTVLESLTQLQGVVKALAVEEPEEVVEKNALRKGLDSVLGAMEKLVKGKNDPPEDSPTGDKTEKALKGINDIVKSLKEDSPKDSPTEDKTEKALKDINGIVKSLKEDDSPTEDKTEKALKEINDIVKSLKTDDSPVDSPTGDKTEKALKGINDIVKSLKEDDPDFQEAYESSKLVKGLCDTINVQNEAIDKLTNEIGTIKKSITDIGETQDSFIKSFAEIKKAEGELIKSIHANVDTIGKAPNPRKSVQPSAVVEPLHKSFLDSENLNNADLGGGEALKTHAQKVEIISKSIQDGDSRVNLFEATNFETTGALTPGVEAVLKEKKAL